MPGKNKPKKRKTGNDMPKDNSSADPPIHQKAIAGLRCIIDPHTNISVYDMGLITDMKATKKSISLTFRPTSPFCPLATQLAMNILRSMHDLDEVTEVCVTVVGHYQEDNINKVLKDFGKTESPRRKPGKRKSTKGNS